MNLDQSSIKDQCNDSTQNHDLRSTNESNESSFTIVDKNSSMPVDQNTTIVEHESRPTIFSNVDGIVNNLKAPVDEELQLSVFKTLLCSYCSKKFTNNSRLRKHLRGVHKILYSCPHCNKAFKSKLMMKAHCQEVHQQQLSLDTSWVNDNRGVPITEGDNANIKCIECNIKFGNVRILRDHLSKYHNLNNVEKEICFPNMIAFKKWKLDIERKERTFFNAAHGYQKGSDCNRCLYRCHRSGKIEANDPENQKKMRNAIGSMKTGITCTALMVVSEYPEKVHVRYCLQHYGHGQEITFVQLSDEEQAAVNENVSKGIPLQEQLDDIKHAQSLADHFQARMIKIKDMHRISSAFASEIYNAGMSANEYVEQWVRVCTEMEDSPILLYRQEKIGAKTEDTMLIIMTEFQKHILMTSNREVVCLDSHSRVKPCNYFFTSLIVMDDQDVAFPVAFCISSELNRNSMLEFLSSVKESTGPLSCSYFMSNKDKIYFEAWQEVMQDNSRWIWNIWSFADNIQKHMRLVKHIPTREATYRLLRTIMECNNQDVFATMLKNFKYSLLNNTLCSDFGAFFELHYGSNQEMWACCYRKDLKYSTNFYLEYMHKTLHHCFTKSRSKQLDKFLLVLMKYLRFKMIDRLSNMLDVEKIDLVKKTITMCHDMGLEIECESISSLSDKIWLIQYKNEVDAYVTREYTTCPEMCDLKCPDCDVCVHMYSCSCVHSIINANMCKHIHAVVWKLLTPHFSPPASPEPDPYDNVYEVPDEEPPILDKSSDLLNSILKRLQGVFKQVRMNKCKLNKNSFSEVLKLLDKCYKICSSCDATCDLSSKSTQTEDWHPISSIHQLKGQTNNGSSSNSENITPIYMATSNPGWKVIANTTLNSFKVQNKPDFMPLTSSIPGLVAVQNVALSSARNANPASIILIPSDPGQNSVNYSACKASKIIPVSASNPVLNTSDDSTSISEKQKQVAAAIPSAISNPIVNVLDTTLSSGKCKAIVLPSGLTPNANSLPPSKKPQKRTFKQVSLGSVPNPVSNSKRVKKFCIKRVHFKDHSPILVKNSQMVIKTTAPPLGNLSAISVNSVPNSVTNGKTVTKKNHIGRTSVSDVPVMKDSGNASENLHTNSKLLIETADSSSDSFPHASDNTLSDFVLQVPSVVKPVKEITCVALDTVSVETASKQVSQTPATVQLFKFNKNSDANAHSSSQVIYVPVSYASANSESNTISSNLLNGKPALLSSGSSKYPNASTNSSGKIPSAEKPSDKMPSSSQILLNSSSFRKNTKSDIPCVIASYQSLNVLSDKSETQIPQDSVSKKNDVINTTVSSSEVLSNQSDDTVSTHKPTPESGSSPIASSNAPNVNGCPDSNEVGNIILGNIKTEPSDSDSNSEIPEKTFGTKRSICSVCNASKGPLFKIPTNKERMKETVILKEETDSSIGNADTNYLWTKDIGSRTSKKKMYFMRFFWKII